MIISAPMLLAATLLLALILRLILGYFDLLPKVSLYVPLTGILILVAGILLTLFSTEKLNEAEKIKQWPTVTGIIVNSYLAGERAKHPVVEYTYQVDSVNYSGTSAVYIPSFGGKKRKKEVAAKTLALYLPGDTIRIFYNQENHTETKIHAGATWESYGQLGLGLFFLIGSIILVTLRRKQN